MEHGAIIIGLLGMLGTAFQYFASKLLIWIQNNLYTISREGEKGIIKTN